MNSIELIIIVYLCTFIFSKIPGGKQYFWTSPLNNYLMYNIINIMHAQAMQAVKSEKTEGNLIAPCYVNLSYVMTGGVIN